MAAKGGAVDFDSTSPERVASTVSADIASRSLCIRCSVPVYDGTELGAIDKDGTWGRFFTGAPARHRRCR